MDKDFIPQQEKPLISYEHSFALATRLHAEYHDQLVLAEGFGRSNIPDALSNVPDEIRSKFYGHGITRGGKYNTEADKLAAFINILDNSTIKGDSGHLQSGRGALGAYTNTDFLIISHFDKELNVSGPSEEVRQIRNEIGWVADIGAYVVSKKYYPIIEELKLLYPDKNIIRADEIPQYMREEAVR